ncbi:MAG TPA: serine/threonine-protein kinase [Gaiellaceae bacterium]|jgi:serine/threonine-protein kinase|nr:serine/threonine-protein kinase [Gaiellaceae bacterium]
MTVDQGADRRLQTVVGGYRIVEPLGRGGTSVVYRAEHVRLGRTAALKLLAPALGESDNRHERFLRESKLAASLDHPNIVPVYDAGEENGLLYIAMACIEGDDLKTLLVKEGALPPRRALRIVSQVAAALDAAHARGLVHRDVKPANILIGDGDRAYLSDFGVVKEIAEVGTTRTGSFVGTIDYCAPEQIEGRDVDARADVYALACVLYECLVGTPPFHRSSDVAILNAHLHAPPPKLSKAAPDLPPALEPVLAKALSKSPLDRYASCGEFVAAARTAVAAPRVSHGRLVISLAVLAAAALVGALVAVAVDHFGFRSAAPAPVTVTNVETTTVRVRPTRPTLETLLFKSKDPKTLNGAAFALIDAGEYATALPFAEKAMHQAKRGTKTLGYATFNTGYALYHLGQCTQALTYLRSSLKLEPKANAGDIQPWITAAQNCAQGGASSQVQSHSSGAQPGSSQGP